jgi:CreA protein
MKKFGLGVLALLMTTSAAFAAGKEIGKVDTAFNLFGANHKVVVERFDDPKVPNASCYVSYAKTGGVGALFGLETDPSRFSIACRATGPIKAVEGVSNKFETVFDKKSSFLFKEMIVARSYDAEKKVYIYLVYSTELIDGSPFNSVSAIALDK